MGVPGRGEDAVVCCARSYKQKKVIGRRKGGERKKKSENRESLRNIKNENPFLGGTGETRTP